LLPFSHSLVISGAKDLLLMVNKALLA